MSRLCPHDEKSVAGNFPSGVNIVRFVNRVIFASPRIPAIEPSQLMPSYQDIVKHDSEDEVRHYVTMRETIAVDASPGLLCLCLAFQGRD